MSEDRENEVPELLKWISPGEGAIWYMAKDFHDVTCSSEPYWCEQEQDWMCTLLEAPFPVPCGELQFLFDFDHVMEYFSLFEQVMALSSMVSDKAQSLRFIEAMLKGPKSAHAKQKIREVRESFENIDFEEFIVNSMDAIERTLPLSYKKSKERRNKIVQMFRTK